jgi:hypothetical protein
MSLALDLKLLAATAFTLGARRPVTLEALLPTSAQPSLERRVAPARPEPKRVLRQEM